MNAIARVLPIDEPQQQPHDFGAMLAALRLRAGMSQNALGVASKLNASYVNRLESGERSRPTERVCFRLARAMGLSPAATDRLLLSAGYAPTWLRYLGSGDATLAALTAALTDDRLDAGTLADLRATVETICLRFSGRVLPAGRAARRLPE